MSDWILKVGKIDGEWDYNVGGIIGWTQQDLDEFLDMCQDAMTAARDQFAQNTKALNALHEALSNQQEPRSEEAPDANLTKE